MKLIMIRHPETQANLNKKYIGHSHSQYTEKGQKQCQKIVRFLEKESFDIIYTSPLPRAEKLARLISSQYKCELIIEDALKEMNFGIFEGRSYQEAESKYKEEWDSWTGDYINYRIPDGESCKEVYKRVGNFVDSLISNCGNSRCCNEKSNHAIAANPGDKQKVFLLISHGGIIQTIITYLLDLKIEDRWHFKISTGGLVEIEYKNDYAVINRIIQISR